MKQVTSATVVCTTVIHLFLAMPIEKKPYKRVVISPIIQPSLLTIPKKSPIDLHSRMIQRIRTSATPKNLSVLIGSYLAATAGLTFWTNLQNKQAESLVRARISKGF